MSNATVVGSGPIAFTTKEGQALSIPLTAPVINGDKIEFKDSNYPAKIQVQPWLDYLVSIDEQKDAVKATATAFIS